MSHHPINLLTVSDLTYRIKEVLEMEDELQEIAVQGEVSNCTIHGSGHAYFTLKDEQAQVSCVMFRMYVDSQAKAALKQGAKLVVQGNVTVYVQRGNYQLLVREIRAAGTGDLYQQFLWLKEKLQAEGLFDESHKRTLPVFPRTIGVVTSPTGAVIQDITRTLTRRFPCVNLVLSPSLVQGEGAPQSVIRALSRLAGHPDVEVIIIARGGGSIEDLWCFNDERVARAVFACQVPVVSAIGHETDFTILDFIADVRAATPTAAAAYVVPDKDELTAMLRQMRVGIRTGIQYKLYADQQLLDDWSEQLHLRRKYLFKDKHSEVAVLQAQLREHNPQACLEKGYGLVLKNGQPVTSATDVAPGDPLEVVLRDGRIRTRVE